MKTVVEQPEEKLEESQETARDTVIANGIHMWACLEVRDELIAIGLEWTCVGILRGLNLGLFWDVYWIIIFLYDYKYNIVVFDRPIDVLMWIGR